jgi:hypothetical protein
VHVATFEGKPVVVTISVRQHEVVGMVDYAAQFGLEYRYAGSDGFLGRRSLYALSGAKGSDPKIVDAALQTLVKAAVEAQAY